MTLKKILGIEQTDGTEVLIRVFKSDFRGPAEKAQGGH